MWEQYRKRFVVTQVFIAILCAAAVWRLKSDWRVVAVLIVTTEVFALVGAAWSARLKRKIESRKDRLPLERRT